MNWNLGPRVMWWFCRSLIITFFLSVLCSKLTAAKWFGYLCLYWSPLQSSMAPPLPVMRLLKQPVVHKWQNKWVEWGTKWFTPSGEGWGWGSVGGFHSFPPFYEGLLIFYRRMVQSKWFLICGRLNALMQFYGTKRALPVGVEGSWWDGWEGLRGLCSSADACKSICIDRRQRGRLLQLCNKLSIKQSGDCWAQRWKKEEIWFTFKSLLSRYAFMILHALSCPVYEVNCDVNFSVWPCRWWSVFLSSWFIRSL